MEAWNTHTWKQGSGWCKGQNYLPYRCADSGYSCDTEQRKSTYKVNLLVVVQHNLRLKRPHKGSHLERYPVPNQAVLSRTRAAVQRVLCRTCAVAGGADTGTGPLSCPSPGSCQARAGTSTALPVASCFTWLCSRCHSDIHQKMIKQKGILSGPLWLWCIHYFILISTYSKCWIQTTPNSTWHGSCFLPFSTETVVHVLWFCPMNDFHLAFHTSTELPLLFSLRLYGCTSSLAPRGKCHSSRNRRDLSLVRLCQLGTPLMAVAGTVPLPAALWAPGRRGRSRWWLV